VSITIRKTRKGTTIHFRGLSARAAFEGMTGTKLPAKTQFKSIVLWPETVSLGRDPNESTDTHHSREAAEHVCRMIERNGLGR